MPITQAPKSPGKTSSTKTSSTTASTVAQVYESPRDKDRREGAEGIFSLATMVSLMRGHYADAGAFSKHGPPIAREAMLLGKKNEQVGKALDLLGQAGPYAGIIFATIPLVAQLAVNHGRLEATKVAGLQGVTSPAALEADVKKELAEMELQALQAQREAEAAVTALKAEQDKEGSPNGIVSAPAAV